MNHSLYALFVLLLATAISACSSNSNDTVTYEITSASATTSGQPSSTQRDESPKSSSVITYDETSSDTDSAPYKLGFKHAQELVRCGADTSRINDCLLDINARITNIRSRIGEDAAKQYTNGLRDYLRENDAALATLLF